MNRLLTHESRLSPFEKLRLQERLTGFADWPLLERLEPRTDLFLYDVKIIDEDAHNRLLGVPNAVIIGNLRRLAQLRDRIVVRIPVVPGFTAVGDNIPRIFELIASLPRLRTVHLLPYHGLGRSKYTSAGQTYPAEGTRPPGPELLEELTAAAGNLGLDCTVGGREGRATFLSQRAGDCRGGRLALSRGSPSRTLHSRARLIDDERQGGPA